MRFYDRLLRAQRELKWDPATHDVLTQAVADMRKDRFGNVYRALKQLYYTAPPVVAMGLGHLVDHADDVLRGFIPYEADDA